MVCFTSPVRLGLPCNADPYATPRQSLTKTVDASRAKRSQARAAPSSNGREGASSAAKDRTFKTVRPNQGTASETVPIPRRPSL